MKKFPFVSKVLRVDDYAVEPSESRSALSFLIEAQTPDGPLALEFSQDAAVELVEELGRLLRERFP
jgi:hypothetical protein